MVENGCYDSVLLFARCTFVLQLKVVLKTCPLAIIAGGHVGLIGVVGY